MEEPSRDTAAPRDLVDQSHAAARAKAEDRTTPERPWPLFEDISDAEDDEPRPSADPPQRSPLVGAASSTWDAVAQSSPPPPPVDCSSSLPPASFAAGPAVSASLSPAPVPAPPPVSALEPGVVLPAPGPTGLMRPLTVDTGCEYPSDAATRRHDDVTTTSPVTSEADGPSPPKIPRLRIVMAAAAGDGEGPSCGWASSPGRVGNCASGAASAVPYVVTLASQQSPQRDVSDDVMDTSSGESASASRHRRKARHKVRR